MKKFKRLFSVVMILAVLFGANAGFAKVDVQAAEAPKKAIFSIDAGRKYFSVEQLKGIMAKAHNNGYTDVQILLANDATRFFLDDMTVTTDEHVYASDDVKAALEAGNAKYYADPNGDHLTEAEMDEIIAYANSLGLGIIPGINSPGHMDSILTAMRELGIENPAYINQENGKESERTVDLSNKEAVAFTQALVGKYVDYFTGTSEYFNFGLDEYANDALGEGVYSGWQNLINIGMYDEFVTYVNDMAAMIKEAGMRPVAFNDGLYYRDTNNKVDGDPTYDLEKYGKFDQDIIVSYWTAGWWEFYVAKPEYIRSMGHEMFNLNDGWYWVVGNIDGQLGDNPNGPYPYNNTIKNIGSIDFNKVTGSQGEITTLGSIQAVWCDDPSQAHDMDRIYTLMDKFSSYYKGYMPRPAGATADYYQLDEVIATIPEDLSVYTDESVAALNNTVDGIIRSLTTENQAIVDGYKADVETAVAELQKKPADYTKVDEALAKVPADLSVYTDESVAALQTAIDGVNRGLNIDEQATVDGYAQAIETAIANLQLKPGATTPGEDGANTPGNNGGNAATGIEENNAAATVVAAVGLCVIAAAGVVVFVARRRATK